MRKRKRSTASRPTQARSADFILGRDRFARISAVEGIELTKDMREMFERFDREGLSAEECRRAIVRRFTSA